MAPWMPPSFVGVFLYEVLGLFDTRNHRSLREGSRGFPAGPLGSNVRVSATELAQQAAGFF